MKDTTHHIRHIQRKVIQSSRKARMLEETANGKSMVMAVNTSEDSSNYKKKK